ncbi:hypothetical protein D6764_02445 [Candidatus Woesearchaeota archaeon]|nr:MAG: hypothetical protein D6764_02445 [Candidatus Woesearchaeota archaeon]
MRFSRYLNDVSRYTKALEDIDAAVRSAAGLESTNDSDVKDPVSLEIARQLGLIPDSSSSQAAYYPEDFGQGFFLAADDTAQSTYADNYLGRVLSSYLEQWESERNDFTRRVPFKIVRKQPKNIMGGVLGYTILNEGWIVLRDDLEGDLKHLVDVHESIHTPDEYETRVITSWMLSDEKPMSMRY